MKRWCHVVPLVAAATLLAGCFLFHGSPEPTPTPTPTADAGGSPVDAGALPPPTRRDAGGPTRPPPPPPPPPPGCEPHDLGMACTDTGNGAVPVGVTYELPVAFGGPGECWCGEQIECAGEIVGPGQLALSSFVCVELLCDGCFPYVQGTCTLPPLDEGDWHVTMNGRDAFDLRVTDETPAIGPIDACVTPAGEPLFGCPLSWNPRPEPVDQICIPGTIPPGVPTAVEVTDFCLQCGFTLGSCEVVRTANTVRVVPTGHPPSCDIDCGIDCTPTESRCFLPPLEEGVYTVTIDGLQGALTLTVDEGVPPGPATSCLSVPED
ncbi:MAG: hypothetical protein KC619_31185 [Myxococcales bacterium]|nr:hypothetical protein [Myxococcales bacterium]